MVGVLNKEEDKFERGHCRFSCGICVAPLPSGALCTLHPTPICLRALLSLLGSNIDQGRDTLGKASLDPSDPSLARPLLNLRHRSLPQ